MEEENSSNPTFARILKTILLFLENNNFQHTVGVLRDEIGKKLPDITIKEIHPRTVILRPMDITTNVDATISDENLIICISGVNTSGHKKNPDNRNNNDATDLLHVLSTNIKSSEELYSTLPPANLQETDKAEEYAESDNNVVSANRKDVVNNSTKNQISIKPKTIIKRVETSSKYNSDNDGSIEGTGDIEITDKRKLEKSHSNNITKNSASAGQPQRIQKAKSASPTRTSQNNPKAQSPKKVKSHPVSSNVQKRHEKKLEETESTSEVASVFKTLEQRVGNADAQNPIHNNHADLPEHLNNCESENKNNLEGNLVPDNNVSEDESEAHGDNMNYDDNCTTSCDEINVHTNSEVPLLPPPQEGAVLSKPFEPPKVTPVSCTAIKRVHPFCQLNYEEVKNVLRNGTCELKLKILQALRWRLTRTDSKIRDNNLVCYITHDILDIGEGSTFFEQSFKMAKDCNSLAIQEEASRFINTLASLSMGREYLEKCPNLIHILVPILKKLEGDERIHFQSLTRQFVMATIQKLSLGGKVRRALINEGIVEWLIKYVLNYHNVMTDYEAEYSVALFSNLCIHKTMRELCEATPDDTAKLLNVLVYTPHKCCLPYLSGILGSLLTSPAINQRAAALNIQKKLKSLAQCAGDDETRHQLEFIIQLHESSSHCKCEYDVVEEPQVYSDHLECELGMNETNYSDPVGEKFLEGFCSTSLCLEKHVQVVKRSCSAISYQQITDNSEADRCNNCEVVKKANKPMTKVDIFKDFLYQVPWSSSTVALAPQTTSQSCHLSYQNQNRPVCAPVNNSANVSKTKYSCACYEEIKNEHMPEEGVTKNSVVKKRLKNSGRKANNVV